MEIAIVLYSWVFCFTALIQKEIKAIAIKASLEKNRSSGNPQVTVPEELILAVFTGTIKAKTTQIVIKIIILRSTSCLCSTELAIAAKTKLKGHKTLPMKIILPQKKSRFEKVDHSPKSGVKKRTPSQRQPAKNPRKKITSVLWVFSKSFIKRTVAKGTKIVAREIAIIVAVKLYFKNEKFAIKAGIRNVGGGIIALLKRATKNKHRATAMQRIEIRKNNCITRLRTFKVMRKY